MSVQEVPQGEAASSQTRTGREAEKSSGLKDEDKVRSKHSPAGSPHGHVDMEIRQRRLQRFYSLPTSSLNASVKTVDEVAPGRGERGGPEERSDHSPEDTASGETNRLE